MYKKELIIKMMEAKHLCESDNETIQVEAMLDVVLNSKFMTL